MDATEFPHEYARRFNEGNPRAEFGPLADLRTEDARLIWRGPDMPEVQGRVASARFVMPAEATLAFSDVVAHDDGRRVTARLTGTGFPRGTVTGHATFHLVDGLLDELVVELDHPITD